MPDYLKQHLMTLIPASTESDICSLLQYVPLSIELKHGQNICKIVFQHHIINEQTFKLESLQMVQPSCIFLIIPQVTQTQQQMQQYIKLNLKFLKQIKIPIIPICASQNFLISQQLQKILQDCSLQLYRNSNDLINKSCELLINKRKEFLNDFLNNLGGDYSVIYGQSSEKGGCGGQ